MEPILIPIIILSVPLVGGLLFLCIEVVRSIAPYHLFTLHAKLVTKGFYRTKRHDGSFDVTSLFVRTRVRENRFREGRIEFDVDGGLNDFFQINYNQATGKLEEFNCGKHFAKGVNNGNFIALLEQYIPYILEREWGKKSERVMAMEKIQTLGQVFQPKHVTPSKKTFQILQTTAPSQTIQGLVQGINALARKIDAEKEQLEIEEQHAFETLLHKRLPNLLKHAQAQEAEVTVLLKEVLHKLNEWQHALEEGKTDQFEREAVLIKKITQR